MNPFTRSLLEHVRDRRVGAFVMLWDALEDLVVRVYRGGAATEQDEAEYRHLRHRLQREVDTWGPRLRPHWQRTHIGGRPTEEDPFLSLLRARRAADFIGDWAAMQTLPAARETLDHLLMEIIEQEAGA